MKTPEQFIEAIKRGVDHGPTPFELIWRSPKKRYVIFKKKGYMTWGGRGHRRYVPTKHYLFDLASEWRRWHGFTLYLNSKVQEYSGRVSKTSIALLQSIAIEREKERIPKAL